MEHERAASLVADYVAGGLDAPDRAELEAHVASCTSCRELVERATELKDVLPSAPDERLLGHVQSALLVRWALRPGEVEDDVGGRIRRHLDVCDVCREAAEIVRGPVAARAPAEPRRAGGGLWTWLTRGVLHPVPALAYLVLLVALAGVWMFRTAPQGAGVELLPPSVAIYPPERFRSTGETGTEPVEVPLAPGRDLHLQVHTEIDEDLLDDPQAGFRLELRDDGDTLLSRTLRRSDLSDYGVVHLRLPAGRLRPGADYDLEILLDLPGSPRDGERLFAATFRTVPDRS